MNSSNEIENQQHTDNGNEWQRMKEKTRESEKERKKGNNNAKLPNN